MNPLFCILGAFGAVWWLGRHDRKQFAPRSNPYLVRTVSYTPSLGDVGERHLASVWLYDRETADAFAADLAQRNRARVQIEEGPQPMPLSVIDKDTYIPPIGTRRATVAEVQASAQKKPKSR